MSRLFGRQMSAFALFLRCLRFSAEAANHRVEDAIEMDESKIDMPKE